MISLITLISGFLFFFSGITLILTSTTSPPIPTNPWNSFHNLTGCHRGDHRAGISSVKRYLHQFGYLPNNTTYDGSFDDGLRRAVLRYQKNFRLDASGVLDLATVDMMMKPRCGVPDIVGDGNGTTVHGRDLYSYFPGVPTWPPNRRNLRYVFYSNGVGIPPVVLRAVFSRAFQRWRQVARVTFTEVFSFQQADIVIQFVGGNHGDGSPFDGRLGVLAHAFAPTDGRLHFDSSELWTGDYYDRPSPYLYQYSSAFDLESVAVHEIGHILGLGHSYDANAIMYPSIGRQTRKVQLAADDIWGIRSLYGGW